ncbi:YadA-like family protein [Actinobacillus delphinicola]|uniref:YadA domain-containing protein n=1 Tax=Actinobacillus delphinicola TaxID=51161 RepID=A0A448TUQ1_9PAST|nr:YadA-like family protein [Actinobacillus delphinicola]VEJ09563.1 YadA domain-containing protein [Actinobacillus delphinicola]
MKKTVIAQAIEFYCSRRYKRNFNHFLKFTFMASLATFIANSVYADDGVLSQDQNNNIYVNSSSGNAGTINGGGGNVIINTDSESNISGGTANTIIGGQNLNINGSQNNLNTLLGGNNNTIDADNNGNTIGNSAIIAGQDNDIKDNSLSNAIIGGNNNTVGDSNATTTQRSVILGGDHSVVTGVGSAIVAGSTNQITNAGSTSSIVGGQNNIITGTGDPTDNNINSMSIIGGAQNKIDEAGNTGIFSGYNNTIGKNATNSVIIGGTKGHIGENAHDSISIEGGYIEGDTDSIPGAAQNSQGIGRLGRGPDGSWNIPAAPAHDSIAIGRQSTILAPNSIAIGAGSQANMMMGNPHDDKSGAAVAIGFKAKADSSNDVAIGSYSEAQRTTRTIDRVYHEAGPNPHTHVRDTVFGPERMFGNDKSDILASTSGLLGAVAVGSPGANGKEKTRQITHVAAGGDLTDAVNVAQLGAVAHFSERGFDITADKADTTKSVDTTYNTPNKNVINGDTINFTGKSGVATNFDPQQGDVVTSTTTKLTQDSAGNNIKIHTINFDLNKITDESQITADETHVISAGAAFNAIKNSKTTLTTQNDSGLKLTPTIGDGMIGNSYAINLDFPFITNHLKMNYEVNNTGNSSVSLAHGFDFTGDNNVTIKDGSNGEIQFSLNKNITVEDTVQGTTIQAGNNQLNANGLTVNNVTGLATNQIDNTGNPANGATAADAVSIGSLTSYVGNKLAGQTISYSANGQNAQTTTLSQGFNFQGTQDQTEISTEKDGVVKIGLAQKLTDTIAKNTATATAAQNTANTNAKNIGNNTQSIATNTGNIAKNTNAVKTAQDAANTNAKNIGNNTQSIATNTGNITKNTDAVKAAQEAANTNAKNISNDADSIAKNTNSISDNSKNLASLGKTLDTLHSAADKGIEFTTANGTKTVKLGEKVNIAGDSNIQVSANTSGLNISLNKDLNVDSITAKNTITAGSVSAKTVSATNGATLGQIHINGNKVTGLATNQIDNTGNPANGATSSDAVSIGSLTSYVGNKLAGQTISYSANGQNAQTTTLSQGLNFQSIQDQTEISTEKGGVVKIGLAQKLTDTIAKNTATANAAQNTANTNTKNIDNNTHSITTNTGNIAKNTNAVKAAQDATNTNAKNIGNNTQSIATNTGNITKNTDAVKAAQDAANTNAKNISNNADSIAKNTNSISDNSKNLANLGKTLDTLHSAADKGIEFTTANGTKTVKLGEKVNVAGDSNIQVSADTHGLNISLNKDLNVDSITAKNTVKAENVSTTTISASNGATLGQIHINGNKVTGLATNQIDNTGNPANGATAADAVSIGSLTSYVGNKLVGQTISYSANGQNAQTTPLSQGFNFQGTQDQTEISTEKGGVVKIGLAQKLTDTIAKNTATANAAQNTANTNAKNIGNNTQSIATNTGNIAKNTNAVKTAQDAANTNAKNIGDNTQSIATNTGNIAKNTNAVKTAQNAANTNAKNISTNTNSISDNSKNLANLGKTLDTLHSAADKGIEFTTANGTKTVKLGEKVNVAGDSNIQVSANTSGLNISLNKDLNVDSITAKNTITAGSVSAKTVSATNGATLGQIHIDGQNITGLNGAQDIKDSKDKSAAASIGGVQSAIKNAVSGLTNQGLTFAGNTGKTKIELGNIVNIKGASTLLKGETQGANNINVTASSNGLAITLNPNVTVDGLTAKSVIIKSGGKVTGLATNQDFTNTQDAQDAASVGSVKNYVDQVLTGDKGIANEKLTFTDGKNSTSIKLGGSVNVSGDSNINVNTKNGIHISLNKNVAVDSIKAGTNSFNKDGLTANKISGNILEGTTIKGTTITASNGKLTSILTSDGLTAPKVTITNGGSVTGLSTSQFTNGTTAKGVNNTDAVSIGSVISYVGSKLANQTISYGANGQKNNQTTTFNKGFNFQQTDGETTVSVAPNGVVKIGLNQTFKQQVTTNTSNIKDLQEQVTRDNQGLHAAIDKTNQAVAQNAKDIKTNKANTDKAIDENKTAIGENKSAIGDNKTAIGENKSAIGDNKTAIGENKSAIGNNKTAIGENKSAIGENKTAIGENKSAIGENKTAIGANKSAIGENKTAIGANKSAIGENKTAIGENKSAIGENKTAIGKNTSAIGENKTAIGKNTSAIGGNKTAIGANKSAIGDNKTAIGKNTSAIGENKTAIGKNTSAIGDNKTAIGKNTSAIGENKTAIGKNTSAIGENKTAIGENKSAIGDNKTAIGENKSAIGENKTAIGKNTSAIGENKTAIGKNTSTIGENKTAIGENKSAIGENKTAIGANKSAIGENKTAIGANKSAIGENKTAIGENKSAIGENKTAIGKNTSAIGENKTAIGANKSAIGENKTAIGENKSAIGENKTAIGKNTSAIGENKTAIGENKSAIGENKTAIGKNTSAIGENKTAISANKSAIGENKTAIGENKSAIGENKTAIGKNTSAIGENKTAIGANKSAIGDNKTAIGENKSAIGENKTAIGKNTSAIDENKTAIGANKSAIGENKTAIGKNTSAIGENKTAIGANRSAIGENKTAIGKNTSAIGDNKTAIGKNTSAIGENKTAIGANKSAIGENKTAIGKNASTIGENKSAISANKTAIAGNTSAIAANKKATAEEINALKDQVGKNNGNLQTQINQNKQSSSKNAKAIEDNKTAAKIAEQNLQNQITQNQKSNTDRYTQLHGLIVNNQGKITHVENTIKQSNITIAKGLNFSGDQGKTVNRQLGETFNINGDKQNISTTTTANGVEVKLNDDVKVKHSLTVGNNTVINDKDGIKTNKVVTGDTTMDSNGVRVQDKTGASASISAKQGVTVHGHNGSQVTIKSNSISFSKDHHGTIHNVDVDVNDPTSVANVGYVNKAMVANAAANQALNQRMDDLDHRVNKMNKDLRGGVASAIAMGFLQTPALASQSMVSAAIGTYHSQEAVAVGYGHRSDDGKMSFKVGFSVNTRKDLGAGAGIGYAW